MDTKFEFALLLRCTLHLFLVPSLRPLPSVSGFIFPYLISYFREKQIPNLPSSFPAPSYFVANPNPSPIRIRMRMYFYFGARVHACCTEPEADGLIKLSYPTCFREICGVVLGRADGRKSVSFDASESDSRLDWVMWKKESPSVPECCNDVGFPFSH